MTEVLVGKQQLAVAEASSTPVRQVHVLSSCSWSSSNVAPPGLQVDDAAMLTSLMGTGVSQTGDALGTYSTPPSERKRKFQINDRLGYLCCVRSKHRPASVWSCLVRE